MSLKRILRIVIDPFVSLFRTKQPTMQSVISKMPDFQTIEEIVGWVERKHQEENAQLQAKVMKLEQRLEEKQKQKETINQEHEIMKVVHRRKLEIIKLKQTRSLKFEIKGLEKYPTFFLKNNRPFGQFKGVMLQETDDGGLIWYPLIIVNKQEVKFQQHAFRFGDFFKSELGIVSQMRGGKVDTNFDIDENGQAIIRPQNDALHKPGNSPVITDDLRKLFDQQKVSESLIQDYEKKYADLKSRTQEIQGILQDTLKEKEELHKQLVDAGIKVQVAQTDRDLYATNVATEAKAKEVTTKTIIDALSAIQDTKVSQVMTQRMNQQILDAMAKMRKKYQDRLYKEEGEIEEAKITDIAKTTASATASEMATKVPPVPQPAPQATPSA